MSVLTRLEGKDSLGDTGIAGKKSILFITSQIQLDQHHNAINHIENIFNIFTVKIFRGLLKE